MAAQARLAIAVLMQRRASHHIWGGDTWEAVAVVPDSGTTPAITMLTTSPERDTYLVPGLELQLHRDEHDGYYENCIAPEAKVFVLWRMQDGRAIPVEASVSYAEGTRMFDSGERADGVVMPAEIQAWLADYLARNYDPPERGRRRHHHG